MAINIEKQKGTITLCRIPKIKKTNTIPRSIAGALI
jgi:hypothetical protein